MITQASNPMIVAIQRGIKEKVPADVQDAFVTAVDAGLAVMHSPEMRELRDKHLDEAKDPANDAGQGAARLLSKIYHEGGKVIPIAAMVSAAMIFAFEYLDLVEKAGKTAITAETLDRATQVTSDEVLKLLKITPEKVQQIIAMIEATA